MQRSRLARVAGWLFGLMIGRTAAAAAQDVGAFPPLLASPREPAFFAAYVWDRSARLASRLATVGLGQTISLVQSGRWEVGVAAGVFSQFNMDSRTNDLINADYLVGLPVVYHRGAFATRFQVYHQSSHLGDEYLLHTGRRRADLPFESARLRGALERAAQCIHRAHTVRAVLPGSPVLHRRRDLVHALGARPHVPRRASRLHGPAPAAER